MEYTLPRTTDTTSFKGKKRTGTRAGKKKTVSLSFQAPQARAVQVAGTFNEWTPEKSMLKRESTGSWKLDLELPPGRYEYRFVVDGEWVDDPNACNVVGNPFGGKNCVIVVE